jgi:hypothetical protein
MSGRIGIKAVLVDSAGRRNTVVEGGVMAGWRRSDRSLRAKLRSPGRPHVARQEHRRRFWALVAEGRSSEAAGADPVAFQLAHAPNTCARAVIERVATLAGWPARGGPRAAPDRTGAVLRGRGIAYCRYSNTSTYVAMVADVAVERSSGAVRLERMFVSHDCGQMVNPDGVLNQVQGQVIQTASRALYEEVGFDGSAVTTLDWASYPIMRFGDAPRIVVDLVPSDQPPMGAAEPASAPVIAAIANAVFDATGIRFRRIPSMRRGSRPHWQRHEWDQDMSMTTTRRGAAALAAILTAAGPAAALAAAPQAGQQLPGARRFRLGRFEVTALLDGHLDLTLDLFPGAAGADAPALCARASIPPPARSAHRSTHS